MNIKTVARYHCKAFRQKTLGGCIDLILIPDMHISVLIFAQGVKKWWTSISWWPKQPPICLGPINVISILDFRKQKFSRMVLLALEEDTWESVGLFLKCAIGFYR